MAGLGSTIGGSSATPDSAPATPTGTKGIGGAAARFAALGAHVDRVAKSLDAVKASADAALPALTNIQLAMKEGSTFALALRDALQGSGARVNDGATPSQAQQDYANQVADKLQQFEQKLQQVFGTNNQVAQLIDRAVQSIRGGGDVGAAQEVLRAILNAYLPGLQQELFSTDPVIRELAAELERYATSGVLP